MIRMGPRVIMHEPRQGKVPIPGYSRASTANAGPRLPFGPCQGGRPLSPGEAEGHVHTARCRGRPLDDLGRNGCCRCQALVGVSLWAQALHLDQTANQVHETA